MSIAALNWAFQEAPTIPATDRFVLVVLADHADSDGIGAFCSTARIAAHTGLSVRTVKYALDRLETEHRLITPTDPEVYAAKRRAAMRRGGHGGQFPNSYDLRMDLNGGNYAEFLSTPDPAPGTPAESLAGVQGVHPSRVNTSGAADAPLTTGGVQMTTGRGAPAAPEPNTRTTTKTVDTTTESVDTAPTGAGSTIMESAVPDFDDAIIDVAEHLATRVEGNGFTRPKITHAWLTTIERMVRIDGRTVENLHAAIDWACDDEFWSMNIRSPQTLRKQYERLSVEAQRQRARQQPRSFAVLAEFIADGSTLPPVATSGLQGDVLAAIEMTREARG